MSQKKFAELVVSTVDFDSDCVVSFLFLNLYGKPIRTAYTRPARLMDPVLLSEANANALDMLDKRLSGVARLVAINVSRSLSEYNDFNKLLVA